ncbi:nucleolar 27S pre-rRNA processing, Urb2/Npa2 [Tanacetum coccineum]
MADYQSPQTTTSNKNTSRTKKKRKHEDSNNTHKRKPSKSSRINLSNEFANEEKEEEKEEGNVRGSDLVEDVSPWRNLQLVLSLNNKNLDIAKKVELAFKFVNLSLVQVEDDTAQASEAVTFEKVIIFLSNWVQSRLISSEKKVRAEGNTARFGVNGSCLDYKCWKIFKFCLAEGTKQHVSMSISKDILKVIHCIAMNVEVKELTDDELTLYDTMLDCISSIFTSHGGISNENLDLWILVIGTILELVSKVITNKLDSSRTGRVIFSLTCLVLEPFTKFLRLHPNRKNGFHDFVDRILEPLLCLLRASSSEVSQNIVKLVGSKYCAQGLFSLVTPLKGFLTLQSLTKYKVSEEGKPKETKTVIKSYHRHFFDKLGKMVTEKNASALYGEGELFRLYVNCIKSQQVSALNADIRKSLFEFFVQSMEPLLGDIDVYLQDEVEVGPVLQDVHCTLKSVNSILISLMQEKVYVKVDDVSEGACANFLKLICGKITSLSAKISQIVPSTFDIHSGVCKELVEVVATEVVLCIRYLLEIDYEVLGNDLERLWLLMFSYGTLGNTRKDSQEKSAVISEIINLGCHMVNLYSELRQVSTSVVALCKAIRCLVSSVRDINRSESLEYSLYHESWTKSLRLLICSPELMNSIHNAVKSIPEGQVSLCIRELATDLSESLEWIKDSSLGKLYFNLKAEVFGCGISEVYTLVLDSLMVTTGNSSLVGVSLNDLLTIIRPSMSILLSKETDAVHEFLSVVSGIKDETIPAHWICVFFFRLYMSSRSLYRQAVSLAPPTTSKKMSEDMHDPFTAYSGNEWLENTETDDGYFSWIDKPSVSLLHVTEAISEICAKETVTNVSPLTYVLTAMAIQRLVDLKRMINSFEYVVKTKDSKRLHKRLSKLTEEASGLTNFMMGHLSLLNKWQWNVSSEDGWDIAVAAIDKKSLPCAIWCLVCQNIDVWNAHAATKKLKMFLSILLKNSLPYASNDFKQFGEHNYVGNMKTVNAREISSELLSNTMLYEEKFVRKHMAPRFCNFLEELVSPLFSNGENIDLQAQPDWSVILSSLEISKRCSEQEDDASIRMIYTVCQSSLSFLSWMPNRCLSSKSFSLYATCIVNLERLIVRCLMDNSPSMHDRHELLRVFHCCRKTLKHLMVTYCEENMETSQNSCGAIHSVGNFPASWLLDSLLSVQRTFSKDGNTHVKDLMFSLTDYTSHVFLTLIKDSFVHASHFLISSRKSYLQNAVSTFDQEDSDHSESNEACNFMIKAAEALKDHAQSEIASKSHLQSLSSVIACIQGFLWGLSTTLSHMDTQNVNLKAIFLRRNFEPVDRLKLCIDTYTAIINKFLCGLVLQNDNLLEVGDESFNLENVDLGKMHTNSDFLQSLLAEENLEAAFFLRQLFVAYSAILRLNLQIKASLSSNLVNTFISISEILLLKFSNNDGTPSQFTFVFLDGIGKFLEELANHLSSTNSTLSVNVYARLVDLHLKAIGKCISLQQKGATLESHETESSTKTMNGLLVYSSLDELKSRLRMSFMLFVRKPSEAYVSSAVGSIRKALVGLQEGCMASYRITTASSGGRVSSVVAAGVDCLDLVLEAITGRKGLSTVKADILGSVCCLFNIILHLQGPRVFYQNPISNVHNCAEPDPGSVVLMCIEVLTKVSGKHALYQMDAAYVAQALSIPATLFQNILQLRTSEASTQSAFLRSSSIDDKKESNNGKVLDQQYSIELYAACCRMLYTFLRHHKRESLQHIALLQASVSVLLHCLEMVNKEQTVQESNFVWGVQEGVKCGTFLRRIYEEIRQQKDVIGHNCRLFLSSYIVVYSGYGPLKVGIRREIEEALRPGVYALIDACSPDDLQYLHTVLGEGPCRNTLANLQHDYKLNFQYEGKV